MNKFLDEKVARTSPVIYSGESSTALARSATAKGSVRSRNASSCELRFP